MTHNNLGTAYLYRIRGERADNLEQAIGHYEQALQVHPRGLPRGLGWDPQQSWGTPTVTASAASGRRTWSRPSGTTSRRCKCTRREAFPEKRWAMTHNNLGLAYSKDRIRGERAENLEQAISLLSRRWKCTPARPSLKIGPCPKTIWELPTETASAASGRRTWSRPFTTVKQALQVTPAKPTPRNGP
jgi:tetratricopeptide (TPR) repeat protein